MSRPLEERFWEKVDVRGPDDCWEWTASKNDNGYGEIRESAPSTKTLKAHRVSWELHNGPIPVGNGYHGTCVLHKCDNPGCVNPAHLFLGTHEDNMKDMIEKDRHVTYKREKHGRAKLTEEQVLEIRREYVKGSFSHGQSALGKKYEVCHSTIGRIISGEHWK
jgi:hypothetical protein